MFHTALVGKKLWQEAKNRGINAILAPVRPGMVLDLELRRCICPLIKTDTQQAGSRGLDCCAPV